MKYLEDAFKFLFKNYLLAIPMFIAVALPALITSLSTAATGMNMLDMFVRMTRNPEVFAQNPMQLYRSLAPLFVSTGVAGVIGFILYFIAEPSTAGMVNKALETGKSDLNDFKPSLSDNFPKYLVFWLVRILFAILIGVLAAIVLVVLGVLISALEGLGILIMILVIIAAFLIGVAITALVSLWFPAMVVDGLGVMDAIKKSIHIVKGSFWVVLGIILLISIAGGILSGILSFLNFIPVIGPVIHSVIPSFTNVLLVVFYFMVYREKTGRMNVV